MEIYWLDDSAAAGSRPPALTTADGSIESLRRAIEERARVAGILDLVEGERHYETFESCA
jgi:hypothetical protein